MAARFGKVFALPIVKRLGELLAAHVPAEGTVLEVGAGDRAMRALLAELRPAVKYMSLDPDPEGTHDFRDLAEVHARFDAIFSFEVIEHLAIEEIGPWLERLGDLLRPGGALLLSTPNTFYPPDFLRDATHRTPLCYDELGGLVENAGLRVERIVRVYHDPWPRKLLKRYLLGWLFRTLGIDFARQIALVARRPERG
jgi:SAM-dependent methyltransferase